MLVFGYSHTQRKKKKGGMFCLCRVVGNQREKRELVLTRDGEELWFILCRVVHGNKEMNMFNGVIRLGHVVTCGVE